MRRLARYKLGLQDNRVVPSFIKDKNTPLGKAFFHHPDTACNEQVLQVMSLVLSRLKLPVLPDY